MVIAFILIGVIFLVAAVRGTQADLFAVLKNDFTGTDNFIVWMAALLAIGSIGYYRPLRPISTAFLGLVIVVMILAQSKNGSGGFFEMLAKQIEETQQPSGAATSTPSATSSGSSSSAVPSNTANDVLNEADSYLSSGTGIISSVNKAADSLGNLLGF